MATSQNEKATRFRALHEGPSAFLIPNPWDAGSARILAGLGFQALATSSGAEAAVLGRRDGTVSRDEALAHVRAIVRQRLVAGHGAVSPAEDGGLGAARGRQGLEAEPGQDSRRAGVPRVGNQKCARPLVQGAEAGGLLVLTRRHRVPSWARGYTRSRPCMILSR